MSKKQQNIPKNSNLSIATSSRCNNAMSDERFMLQMLQVVNDVAARDADWVDWFVGVDKVKNRTGDWFFGVAALRNDVRTTAYSSSMV